MELMLAVIVVTVIIVVIVALAQQGSGAPQVAPATSNDIILGSTIPLDGSSRSRELRLTRREQNYHTLLTGKTGSGKSRLIMSQYIQHLNLGDSTILVEPNSDLSLGIVKFLISQGYFQSPDAFERLIYIDWRNDGPYAPFNLLQGTRDPRANARLALDAMLRVWPSLADAPTFQQLFLSSMICLQASGLPITFLHQLLTVKEFRDNCLKRVEDEPLIHEVFENFDKLGKDQPKEAGSILRRAFLLSFSNETRYSLSQIDNLFDFRKLVDEGKSVIVNLGGVADPETRKLLGALLLVAIEQAALSRADQDEAERRPCWVFVDEWSTIAAQERTLATVLEQCRKYRVAITLAGQSVAQVGSERLSGALENCKTLITFGLGRDSAVTQAQHIADVNPYLVKEAAWTNTQHALYLSISEQFEMQAQQLQKLPPQFCYVRIDERPLQLIRTVGMPDAEVDQAELRQVLETYRTRYQRSRADVEAMSQQLGAPLLEPAKPTKKRAPSYTRLFQPDDVTKSNVNN